MLLALIFGGSILTFLDKIPKSILGVMLTVSGHSLALSGFTFLVETLLSSPIRLRTETAVALLTALVILGLKKTHYGVFAGLVAHIVYGDGFAECRRYFSQGTVAPLAYSRVAASSNEDEN